MHTQQCKSYKFRFWEELLKTIAWEIPTQLVLKNCSKKVWGCLYLYIYVWFRWKRIMQTSTQICRRLLLSHKELMSLLMILGPVYLWEDAGTWVQKFLMKISNYLKFYFVSFLKAQCVSLLISTLCSFQGVLKVSSHSG